MDVVLHHSIYRAGSETHCLGASHGAGKPLAFSFPISCSNLFSLSESFISSSESIQRVRTLFIHAPGTPWLPTLILETFLISFTYLSFICPFSLYRSPRCQILLCYFLGTLCRSGESLSTLSPPNIMLVSKNSFLLSFLEYPALYFIDKTPALISLSILTLCLTGFLFAVPTLFPLLRLSLCVF